MLLLLDENMPKRLKLDFPEHEIFTVRDKGWNGIKNGKLLELMLADGFHALLTFDKNMQYQQNFQKYTITVFVLNAATNTYVVLTQLSNKIKALLAVENLPIGPVVIKQDWQVAQKLAKANEQLKKSGPSKLSKQNQQLPGVAAKAMNNMLTKYSSFEAMKRDIRPTTLSAAEKERLDAEVKQLAELLQALRAEKYGTTCK